jgi:hypothetical protein
MSEKKTRLRIGGGSACPGERLEPVIEMLERGNLDYLGFDSLSETELLAFERQKLAEPSAGYDAFTEKRLRAILPLCREKGVKVIGNMGAANPAGALEMAVEVCRDLDLQGMKLASVIGDDVLELIRELDLPIEKTDKTARDFGDALISAHAYIPADPIVDGLSEGASLVMAGRVGDASIYLAPLMYEYGWKEDDRDLLARGIIVGHLLECAGQVSGGYFADPPYKVVPNLHRLGFPIAEVHKDGKCFITKVAGSGGLVSTATCAEQLLYETHDPSHYIEADVISDFKHIEFEETEPDRVRIGGTIRGKPRPDMLKIAIGVREGFRTEGMIFYGGSGALDRAKLAAETMRRRLQEVVDYEGEIRIDFVGLDAFYGPERNGEQVIPREVGVRLAGRCPDLANAMKIAHELETIDNNGPAALARSLRSEDIREVLGYYDAFIPRDQVKTHTIVKEV